LKHDGGAQSPRGQSVSLHDNKYLRKILSSWNLGLINVLFVAACTQPELASDTQHTDALNCGTGATPSHSILLPTADDVITPERVHDVLRKPTVSLSGNEQKTLRGLLTKMPGPVYDIGSFARLSRLKISAREFLLILKIIDHDKPQWREAARTGFLIRTEDAPVMQEFSENTALFMAHLRNSLPNGFRDAFPEDKRTPRPEAFFPPLTASQITQQAYATGRYPPVDTPILVQALFETSQRPTYDEKKEKAFNVMRWFGIHHGFETGFFPNGITYPAQAGGSWVKIGTEITILNYDGEEDTDHFEPVIRLRDGRWFEAIAPSIDVTADLNYQQLTLGVHSDVAHILKFNKAYGAVKLKRVLLYDVDPNNAYVHMVFGIWQPLPSFFVTRS